jgi:hypothetical protein
MPKTITRANWAVTAAVAILVTACSIANLGWLRDSEEVSSTFATLHVTPGYRYWHLYLEESPMRWSA